MRKGREMSISRPPSDLNGYVALRGWADAAAIPVNAIAVFVPLAVLGIANLNFCGNVPTYRLMTEYARTVLNGK